jgi:hypothetical protein
MEQRVANEVASRLHQAEKIVAQFHQLLLGLLRTLTVLCVKSTSFHSKYIHS